MTSNQRMTTNDLLAKLVVDDMHSTKADLALAALNQIKGMCKCSLGDAQSTAQEFFWLGGLQNTILIAKRWKGKDIEIDKACLLIWRRVSCSYKDGLLSVPLVPYGFYETVSGMLDRNKEHEWIHRTSFQFLGSTFQGQAENAWHFAMNCRGIERVVSTMKRFRQSPDVLVACLRTLWHLVHVGGLPRLVAAAGGLQAISDVIQFHADDIKLETLACHTLIVAAGGKVLFDDTDM